MKFGHATFEICKPPAAKCYEEVANILVACYEIVSDLSGVSRVSLCYEDVGDLPCYAEVRRKLRGN